MKVAALLVAVCTIVVGIVGIASPDLLTAVRRQYFATPVAFHVAGALRLAMGVVVISVARRSRAPRILRAMGAVMCLQAVTATVAGPERARAILEWEVTQGNAMLRVGAAAALVAGAFLVFAVTARRPSPGSECSN